MVGLLDQRAPRTMGLLRMNQYQQPQTMQGVRQEIMTAPIGQNRPNEFSTPLPTGRLTPGSVTGRNIAADKLMQMGLSRRQAGNVVGSGGDLEGLGAADFNPITGVPAAFDDYVGDPSFVNSAALAASPLGGGAAVKGLLGVAGMAIPAGVKSMRELISSGVDSVEKYIKAINPTGSRVENPTNLSRGDMYGMLPKDATLIKETDDIKYYEKNGDYYATGINPDLGEEDVIGYIKARGDGTELSVVKESQGQGVGTSLVRMFRAENATAPSGGLSEAGEATNKKAFQEELDQYEEDRLNGLFDPEDEVTDGFFTRTDAEDYASSAIPLLRGEEPLPDLGKNPNLRDVQKFLDARYKSAAGDSRVDFTANNVEAVAKVMADEAFEAASKAGNATTWYRDKVSNAMKIASTIHPELATDNIASTQFKLILAVMSNGATVAENTTSALKAYEQFKLASAGSNFPRMPVEMLEGGGKEINAMRVAFSTYNDLARQLGPEETHRFLNTEFTVKELKDAGFNVSGENVTTKVYGSSIFGPKIGQGFFQNLQGNFKPLTSDRWWMRTWGRLTGKLIDPVEIGGKTFNKQRDRLLEALRSDRKSLRGYKLNDLKKDPQKLIKLSDEIFREYSRTGFKNRTEVNTAAQRISEGQNRVREAPKGGAERNYMRATVARTQELLRERGLDLDVADIQALVWYPEKELMLKLGVGNKRSAPTDYETEFINAAKEYGVTQQQIDAALQGGADGPGRRIDVGSNRPSNEEPRASGYQYPQPLSQERRGNFLNEMAPILEGIKQKKQAGLLN